MSQAIETSAAAAPNFIPAGTKINAVMAFGPDRKLTRRVKHYFEIYYAVPCTADGEGGFTFPDGSQVPEVGFYLNEKRNEIEVDSGLCYDRRMREYFQRNGQKLVAECWLG